MGRSHLSSKYDSNIKYSFRVVHADKQMDVIVVLETKVTSLDIIIVKIEIKK